jgi:hypothetical protein
MIVYRESLKKIWIRKREIPIEVIMAKISIKLMLVITYGNGDEERKEVVEFFTPRMCKGGNPFLYNEELNKQVSDLRQGLKWVVSQEFPEEVKKFY